MPITTRPTITMSTRPAPFSISFALMPLDLLLLEPPPEPAAILTALMPRYEVDHRSAG